MFRQVASVGGLTLLSRVFGFVRDLMIAALLGAGPLADAFNFAFRLPNHFRTIFAEGAFNAAFVPRYAAVLETGGEAAAARFAGAILSLTLLAQVVVLGLALGATEWVVRILTPGLVGDAVRFPLTVDLTRITFPYLAFISVMTLVAGMLNAHNRFAAAAGTAVLLNLCMIAALLLRGLFPTTAHALAWGVTVSGVAQLALVLWDLRHTGQRLRFVRPRRDGDLIAFLAAFGPAVLASAGPQVAVFADSIIASLLPTGSVSYLAYADRLYQLPVAVIGIAVGTVLLPNLAKRIAAGEEGTALRQMNRAVEAILMLTAPCVVLFLLESRAVIEVVFARGQFDAAAVAGSAGALMAYGFGLTAVVVMRALTPGFHARGDTLTPFKALAVATIVNVALKLVLTGPLLHVGLAAATSVAAWVNAALLTLLLVRAGYFTPDARLARMGLVVAVAAIAMAAALVLLRPWVAPLAVAVVDPRWVTPQIWPLAARAALSLALYGGLVLAARRLFAR